MKITSRSILSPGRPGSARDQLPTTLSTSLSRRLKTSRSIKGGASPAMFPTAGKKRGSGFDNPEPSSPKVTCIGQVRVKSKKKHTKNLRSLSRRKTNGEGSFRKFEHLECLQAQRNNSNQKWVHIPLTICEALRTFGSEVSCLFPCRSSCSSTTIQKEEKVDDDNRQGSTCGAALARWIVALQDGDNGVVGAEREVVMVDGNDDDDDGNVRRRHVFQDLEIVNDSVIMGSRDEEGRVSICVPPKNALLLMRCRSDPMKMEALANRFWEPMMDKYEEENEDEEFEHEEDEKVMALDEINDLEDDFEYHEVNQEIVEMDMEQSLHTLPLSGLGIVVADIIKQSVQEENVEKNCVEEEKVEMDLEMVYDDKKESIEINEEKEEESFFLEFLFEENEDQEQDFEKEEEDDDDDFDMEDALGELFREEDGQETETGESNIEKVKLVEDMVIECKDNCDNETHEKIVMELDKVENEILGKENEDIGNTSKALPECLLLMMYEPKLSMEVSKETWVCSNDFIRRSSSRKKPPPLPQPLAKSIAGQDESKVNGSVTTSGVTTDEHNNLVLRTDAVQYERGLNQPARSSCSFPAPLSMATLLEQKLVNTKGYEPLVLTRCKSEPMRSAAAKLKPDTCYWKNKLEPPRRASLA